MLESGHGSVPRRLNGSGVRFGKPCPSGTRIDVATVVGALAAGESEDTVAKEYSLTPAQIRTALAYAAHVAAHLPPAVPQAS